jgi:DNA-binding NarL/FixJ family response regulator
VSNAPVHVVLVDDYPLAREALPGLLAESGIFVSATAASPSEAEEVFDRHNAAVALIGVSAERTEELTRRLARTERPPRVLIRTNESALPDAEDDLPEGVLGAVSRRTPVADLVQAIRTVAAGGTWFESPEERGARRQGRTAELSRQERKVLLELARGSSTEEIAEGMHLTTHTIRSHIRNLMRKLRARSRAHAVAIACTEGIIDLHG